MVPGSTFKYGSNFSRLIVKTRLSSRHPIDADANPFPKEETTPPVTNMNFLSIESPKFRKGCESSLSLGSDTEFGYGVRPRIPRTFATVPDLPVYRSPRIRFRSPRRGFDTHAPALATVRAAPQLPAECVRASETF